MTYSNFSRKNPYEALPAVSIFTPEQHPDIEKPNLSVTPECAVSFLPIFLAKILFLIKSKPGFGIVLPKKRKRC
jgi:hypothetical protein